MAQRKSSSEIAGEGLPRKLWHGYLDAALWSSNHSAGDKGEYPDPRGLDDGDPYDDEYYRDDIDEKSLAKMAGDVRKFLDTADVADAILEASLEYDQDDSKIGHDLWLTQNRHGAGFWDGDYGDDKDPSTPAAILTKAAHKLPERYLTSYVPEGAEDPEDAQIEVM